MARHQLADFELAGIRPSVLTSFYRATGNLSEVRAIANHAHLSTTVGYVDGPKVQSQNQLRIASLQVAFLGHLERGSLHGPDGPVGNSSPALARPMPAGPIPVGGIVSMFGFGCTDPFSGVAPGSHAGELCTHFLGCLTCPNAILPADTATLARLLQAREHLRAAAIALHPARWEVVYAPQLRILEEDILTRFPAHELAAAEALRARLAPLPPLR